MFLREKKGILGIYVTLGWGYFNLQGILISIHVFKDLFYGSNLKSYDCWKCWIVVNVLGLCNNTSKNIDSVTTKDFLESLIIEELDVEPIKNRIGWTNAKFQKNSFVNLHNTIGLRLWRDGLCSELFRDLEGHIGDKVLVGPVCWDDRFRFGLLHLKHVFCGTAAVKLDL